MNKPLLEFNQDTNAKKYSYFRVFKKDLQGIMDGINETGQWEMPPFKTTKAVRQTSTDEIIKKLGIIFNDYPYPTHIQKLKKVTVQPYKKEGVQIHLQYENRKRNGRPIGENDELYYELHYRSEIQKMDRVKPIETYDWYLLKVCKEGFHRDWGRNGICVGDEK